MTLTSVQTHRSHAATTAAGSARGTGRRLRIAMIAGANFGFRQPFAGGMEAHTWDLTLGLRRLGHDVTVYAGPGSDPDLGAEPVEARVMHAPQHRRDVS